MLAPARVTKARVRRYMAAVVDECREGGEVNLTLLAEAAADEFDRDKWLDDPDHWVWDLAIEVKDAVA